MAVVPIFTGRIDDKGELRLTPNEATYRKKWRESLAGHEIELIIRKKRTKRSNKQNRFINSSAATLAAYCGVSLAEMKLELMGECWGWQTLPSGHQVPVKIHTSDMTVDEAAQYIDWFIPWSIEKFPEVPIVMPGQGDEA